LGAAALQQWQGMYKDLFCLIHPPGLATCNGKVKRQQKDGFRECDLL
jgi:hypothetical protein